MIGFVSEAFEQNAFTFSLFLISLSMLARACMCARTHVCACASLYVYLKHSCPLHSNTHKRLCMSLHVPFRVGASACATVQAQFYVGGCTYVP